MDSHVPGILWHQRRVNLLGIHGNGEQFLPRRPVPPGKPEIESGKCW